ncbi:MAG TPA: D-cysteine desulfhydrase [Verrucomicrobiales bacterium]|nr:D-cysteine desulfhydrase [Verrucomicrobiales bacterium]
MDFSQFSRRFYSVHATPIQKLERLSRFLGGPEIYIKRDDLLGLAGGGNKTRKLEFLVGDAIQQGADTLITCGALQSNHCRLTAAAAALEGLKCRLVLQEVVSGIEAHHTNGNRFIDELLGVEIIKTVSSDTDLMAAMGDFSMEASARGCKVYSIPVGGSNALGTLGYVACANEILTQSASMNLNFDHVICPSGSGGTQAGLEAGFRISKSDVSVIGITVSRPGKSQESKVNQLVWEVQLLLGSDHGEASGSAICNGDYFGEGYSLPTPEMIEAVRLVARLESILLDPVYTGKAMTGLIDLIRKGEFRSDQIVLFVHTGGAPALFANTQLFSD